jgi:hypothetical protein
MNKTSHWAGYSASFFAIVTTVVFCIERKGVHIWLAPKDELIASLEFYCWMLTICSSAVCLVSALFECFRNPKKSN